MTQALGQCLKWNALQLGDIPKIQRDEVHLYYLPLQLENEQSARALSLLSDIQRDKHHRRASQALKDAYLAGRYYLLSILGAYLGQAPNEIEISYSRLNKPRLSDPSLDIEFNFTDTNHPDNSDGDQSMGNSSVGLFAFSRGRAVGVDVESRARRIDISKVVDKRFSQSEQTYVKKGDAIDREKALSIWTRKEAYGKATGKGINFQMNAENLVYSESKSSLGRQNDNNQFSFAFNDTHQQAWRCEQIQLGNDFIACLVHEAHQKLVLKTFSSLIIRPNHIP